MQLDIEQIEPTKFYIKNHEARFLDCLCQGLTFKEMVPILGIAERTIKGKATRLGRYFGINVKQRHLNITLVNYWSCELFRKGLIFDEGITRVSLKHRITTCKKRIVKLQNRLSNEMTRLLFLEEDYKDIGNKDVVDRRPTVCHQVG
jgi:hypothetical protein